MRTLIMRTSRRIASTWIAIRTNLVLNLTKLALLCVAYVLPMTLVAVTFSFLMEPDSLFSSEVIASIPASFLGLFVAKKFRNWNVGWWAEVAIFPLVCEATAIVSVSLFHVPGLESFDYESAWLIVTFTPILIFRGINAIFSGPHTGPLRPRSFSEISSHWQSNLSKNNSTVQDRISEHDFVSALEGQEISSHLKRRLNICLFLIVMAIVAVGSVSYIRNENQEFAGIYNLFWPSALYIAVVFYLRALYLQYQIFRYEPAGITLLSKLGEIADNDERIRSELREWSKSGPILVKDAEFVVSMLAQWRSEKQQADFKRKLERNIDGT